MHDDNDERLRERLAALRRITVKRGATKAEAETAKRLADQLAKKLGKRRGRRTRKAPKGVLPEPPQWRRKRLWLIWLEAALAKIDWAGNLLLGVWVATRAILIVLIVLLVFGIGSDDLGKQFSDLYFVGTLILLAVGLLLVACAAVLAVAIWWLRTLPGERLRAALLGCGRHLPAGLIMILPNIVLDTAGSKGWLLGLICSFATTIVAGALIMAWYIWALPLLERKLRSIWCSPRCKFGRTT
jgi:hypothetical protein